MDALDIFLSWQALALAAMSSLVMQGFKRGLDILWPGRKGGTSVGHRLFNGLGMPAIQGLFGFAAGALIPLRPESLVTYVEAHVAIEWVGYGFWGVLVGGIGGDWLYQRFRKVLRSPPNPS